VIFIGRGSLFSGSTTPIVLTECSTSYSFVKYCTVDFVDFNGLGFRKSTFLDFKGSNLSISGHRIFIMILVLPKNG
jgi:hypothetical protein